MDIITVHMPDNRICKPVVRIWMDTKIVLTRWPKEKWKDMIKEDLKHTDVCFDESQWYNEAVT